MSKTKRIAFDIDGVIQRFHRGVHAQGALYGAHWPALDDSGTANLGLR